ncbi:hypothetical protein [Carnobacterium pleistocenium]|uniref:hypothetical protein n=1 Tax=Carnobacterium pleistocenium TaxID=181073 RepID=UPI00054D9876|nr:hypothetical protein [Carnobacterium pleistocenium]
MKKIMKLTEEIEQTQTEIDVLVRVLEEEDFSTNFKAFHLSVIRNMLREKVDKLKRQTEQLNTMLRGHEDDSSKS